MTFVFRRRLLATTLFASVALLAQPAFAQNTPPSPDEPREAEGVQTAPQSDVPDSQTDAGDEIVVTGTLIRNPNLVSSAPVTVVGEAELELRQTNVAEEFLREIPGVVPSIGSQVNNGNGGASFTNLRGLGLNRNLVLLDGKRIVPANLTGAVDLNNIPVALLERTDVLTGGASTTYGADAVAGVVNFITKRDFAGIDLSVSEQITEEGDGNVFRIDVTTGANFADGRGNATFSVGYQQADPVYQGDRPFSNFSLDPITGGAGGSGTTVPVRITIPGTGTRQIDPVTGGFNPTAAFTSFNFAPQNIFQTPFERFNLFGQANYEISDGIDVYTQGLFSKQTVSTIIASSGTFGAPLEIGIGNPFLPAGVRNTLCLAIDRNAAVAGIQPPTQAQCNAAAQTTDRANPAFLSITTPVSRRFVEFGSRDSNYTTTVFNYELGVRGDITENIGFDIFGSYGESENIQRQSGQGLRSRLNQATDAVRAPDVSIVCRDGSNGCAPINLFGPAGTITADTFNFLNVSTSASTLTSLGQVRGVVSGDFGFASPFATENLGFAVGGEYRKYNASTASDVANQTPGEVLGNGAATPDVRGQYDVYEAFGELVLPLIADRPFFKSLTLELGGRYSDYSTSGTSYTYKAAGSWEPVDSLRIRGGYNRATRSPNINELFSPLVTGLDSLATDPCQLALPLGNASLREICLAQGAPAGSIGNISPPSAQQINVTSGGNLNLGVEKADTFTAGVVFQPDFVPGLSISVDYYNIKIKDAITTPTPGDVITACFGSNPAAPPAGAALTAACQSIRRNPLTGGIDGDVSITPGLPQPFSNLGTIKTSGVDLIMSYRRDLGFAKLNLSFNGNWTDESKFQATPTSRNFNGDVGPRECVGLYSINCSFTGSPQPEFTFTQRTTLGIGKTDVSVLWRFIDDLRVEGGLAEGFLPAYSSIDERHYFDLSLRQEVTDDINFVFTVTNLFDKKPPIVGQGIGSTAYNSGNTYPSTYDPLGRRFAVGANLRF